MTVKTEAPPRKTFAERGSCKRGVKERPPIVPDCYQTREHNSLGRKRWPRCVADPTVPKQKFGKRWGIHEDDVLAWMRRNPVVPAKAPVPASNPFPGLYDAD